jgi:3-dehydroquinate synthetase
MTPVFFEWLEVNGGKVLALDPAALSHAVQVSCAAKAAIVAQDEKEGGRARAS